MPLVNLTGIGLKNQYPFNTFRRIINKGFIKKLKN